MQILIRKAKDSDYSAIAEIYAHESVIQHTGQTPGLGQHFWQGFYSNKGVPYQELVAECSGRVVAHLGLLQESDTQRAHVCSFGLVVHPDYQAKGVGSVLLEKLIEIVDHELKLSRIELSVAVNNPRAIALYKRYGFEIEAERKHDLYTLGKFRDSYFMARVKLS